MEFVGTMLRWENAAKENPTDFSDPIEKAKVRQFTKEFYPNSLRAFDQANALLAGDDAEITISFETGDHPIRGFVGSEASGPAPETAYFYCVVENSDFTVNRHKQSSTVGIAITNHRILIMCRVPSTDSSFTPYSLSWDDVKSAQLSAGVSDRAVITIITQNRNGEGATYTLQGSKNELAEFDECINAWMTTYREEMEKRIEKMNQPKRNVFTVLGKLFKK